MDLGLVVNEEHATRKLGISKRALRRKKQAGYIRPISRNGKDFYSTDELSLYNKKRTLLANQSKFFKFLYACREMDVHGIENELNPPCTQGWDLVWQTLNMYRIDRKQKLKSFYFNGQKPDTLLMVEEVLSRLNLIDRHIIYRLIENNNLKQHSVESGKGQKIMVTKGSLQNLLGEYSSHILYRSGEVSNYLGQTVNRIDKLARQHGIGLKMGDKQNNVYLFTLGEAQYLNNCKRKY